MTERSATTETPKTSLLVGHGSESLRTLLDHAATANESGLDGVWFGQHLSYDAVTVAALAGSRYRGIAVGAGVVPIYPRHPLVVATQAHTASVAAEGRFRLGVGLSHRVFMEAIHGLDYVSPARYLREYLLVLRDLLGARSTSFDGEFFRIDASVTYSEDTAIPLVVGALGPRTLELAGQFADGAITYLAGPRTIEEFVVPHLTAGADTAGRPRPEVIASVPVHLTDDTASARAEAEEFLTFHTQLEAYGTVVQRERVDSPVELAIIGDEGRISDGIARLRAAGVTEFAAAPFGTDADQRRTCEFLAEARP